MKVKVGGISNTFLEMEAGVGVVVGIDGWVPPDTLGIDAGDGDGDGDGAGDGVEVGVAIIGVSSTVYSEKPCTCRVKTWRVLS